MRNPQTFATVPMRTIGPIKITGQVLDEEVLVPLATFESPLWPSTNRGATVSRASNGIRVTIVKDCMTRSVLLEAPNAEEAYTITSALKSYKDELALVVRETSAYADLEDWHTELVGNLIFIRFAMSTGEASGHNMTTKAADSLLDWILLRFPKLKYVSISGNLCTDKKVSAINGILGRGKYVIAEGIISKEICLQYLKTTPEKIVNLNIKKNLIGTLLAGGLRSANAHFANMLLGFYLATGQDAANIVEGSQGIVHAEVKDSDLYFSVTVPNVIVGAIGNGKHHPFVKENLALMGCLPDALSKESKSTTSKSTQSKSTNHCSRRLAAIVGATLWCGELSLLAAQTNKGELMQSHLKLERLERMEA